MTGFRILVADDDQAVRESLDRVLRYEGYEVEFATNGAEALLRVVTDAPDLLILDVRMPSMDGLQACRTLRRAGNRLPILMLTALDTVEERVDGLDAGADDYVVKPFALDELLARLRALLRRSPGTVEGTVLRYADLTLSRTTREVHRGATPIELTRTEFTLLEIMMTHAGEVLSRPDLVQRVWGYDVSTSNSLDVYVGYLRRKLERHGHPRLLHTVRGVGFVLRRQ